MLQKTDLHLYQDLTISHLFERNHALGIQPTGAGKTASAMTAIQELLEEGHVRRVLVLAPSRVAQLVWPYEAEEWDHLKDTFTLTYFAGPVTDWDIDGMSDDYADSRMLWGQIGYLESRLPKQEDHEKKEEMTSLLKNRKRRYNDVNKRVRAEELPYGVYLTSHENIQWLCDVYEPGRWPFDLLVIDEVGKIGRKPTSSRFKALRKHVGGIENVWGLTAAPAPEGLLDLYSTVSLVDGGKRFGKSFYQWRQAHFMPADYQGYNWIIQPGGEKRIYAQIQDIAFRVPDHMLTYRKTTTRVRRMVELPAKAMDLYREMAKTMAVEVDDTEILAMSEAVVSIKLRQIVQGFVYDEDGEPHVIHQEKQHELADLIDEMQREPMLIAYEFAEDLVAIQKVWKNIPHLGSGTSKSEATRLRDSWNAGDLPVMVVHPMSMSHGINLQAGGHNICWYGLVWSADAYQQTQERIDRQGQKHACFAHHILAKNTIDERIFPLLAQKDRVQKDIISHMQSV